MASNFNNITRVETGFRSNKDRKETGGVRRRTGLIKCTLKKCVCVMVVVVVVVSVCVGVCGGGVYFNESLRTA